MRQDKLNLDDRFAGTQLEFFFNNVPVEEINASLDPFAVKDLWMRFFRVGGGKPKINVDRALKNLPSAELVFFVMDEFTTMSDQQLFRAMYTLNKS